MKKYLFLFLFFLFNAHSKEPGPRQQYDLQKKLKPFVVVADNQFHNLYSDRNFMSTIISDSVSPVAIRPPQLNLFAPDLLNYLLDNNAKDKYVVHLGDALNIAAKVEWDKFTEAIASKDRNHLGWVMVPGNHDFTYFGVTMGSLDWGWTMQAWRSASSTTGKSHDKVEKVFDKNVFLESYLNELVAQGKRRPVDFPNSREELIEGKIWENRNHNGFLQKLFYSKDRQRPWRSFIVQEVNLGVPCILIDTCDYDSRPTNTKQVLRLFLPLLGAWAFHQSWGSVNPGLYGEIRSEQISVVTDMMNEINGPRYIMGHHPLNRVLGKVDKIFENKKKDGDGNLIGYVSAHTHHGVKSPVRYHKSMNLYEFNCGSTTDGPPQVASSMEGTLVVNDESKNKACHLENKLLFYEDCFPDQLIGQDNYSFSDRYRYDGYKDSRPFWFPAKHVQNYNVKCLLYSYIRMFDDLDVDEGWLKSHSIGTELEDYQQTYQRLKVWRYYDDNNMEILSFKYRYDLLKELVHLDGLLKKVMPKRRLMYGVRQGMLATMVERNEHYVKDSK